MISKKGVKLIVGLVALSLVLGLLPHAYIVWIVAASPGMSIELADAEPTMTGGSYEIVGAYTDTHTVNGFYQSFTGTDGAAGVFEYPFNTTVTQLDVTIYGWVGAPINVAIYNYTSASYLSLKISWTY